MFSAPRELWRQHWSARFPFPTEKRGVRSLLSSRVNGQSQHVYQQKEKKQ
jgi:hypothetical protein